MPSLRILSLIPSATEIVYLLGLGECLVGRSHDSNYPSEALDKPVVTDTFIDTNLPSHEIDRQVREALHTGRSIFHIDRKLLQKLKPNLILTQELCRVCAPSFSQVKKAARILEGEVKLLSLEPDFLDDVFENVLTVGEHTGRKTQAAKFVASLKAKRQAIVQKFTIVKKLTMPKVVVVEWPDPVMIAGHWVPEMVELAGGQMLLSEPGKQSRYAAWDEIQAAEPEIVIFAPCGFDMQRGKRELGRFKFKKGQQAFLVDGDAYFTRSGPRVLKGVEILAKIFHPDIFGRPLSSEALTLTS